MSTTNNKFFSLPLPTLIADVKNMEELAKAEDKATDDVAAELAKVPYWRRSS